MLESWRFWRKTKATYTFVSLTFNYWSLFDFRPMGTSQLTQWTQKTLLNRNHNSLMNTCYRQRIYFPRLLCKLLSWKFRSRIWSAPQTHSGTRPLASPSETCRPRLQNTRRIINSQRQGIQFRTRARYYKR